jgi:uncharacterized repeat protein (TIGR03803 family)
MKKLGFSKSALVAALLFVTAAIASSAQTFTTLVNFDGTNGASPQGFALAEKDGDLYGATEGGGQYGQGLLFKLTPTGTFTPLYNFCPESGCADGSGPGGLLLATNGEFYGSSFGGGAFGYGTIFEFTGEGAPTTIHSFDDTDGTGFIYLMQGSGGFIYGMASYGGNLAECFAPGCGTVFRIALNGEQFTLLHTFCVLTGCPDGAIPYDALAQGTDGDYYGTTWGGGGRSDGGSVFRMTPRGKLSTIYRFCTDYPACSDGSNPLSVVLGTDGNFYGATAAGSNNSNAGTFFTITPTGAITTLYSFCSKIGCTDGSTPRNGPILGSDGNFYGTTYLGGTSNEGTIYRITPAGGLTRLHSFDGTDGYYPIGQLFQASNGIFYGTTSAGGSGGDGTIFSLDVGLSPLTKTAPPDKSPTP